MQFFGGDFFLRKKTDFLAIFRHGQRSVAEPGPTPSPWSISQHFPFAFKVKVEFSYCNIPPDLDNYAQFDPKMGAAQV